MADDMVGNGDDGELSVRFGWTAYAWEVVERVKQYRIWDDSQITVESTRVPGASERERQFMEQERQNDLVKFGQDTVWMDEVAFVCNAVLRADPHRPLSTAK